MANKTNPAQYNIMTNSWNKWIGKKKLCMTKAQKKCYEAHRLYEAYKRVPGGVFEFKWVRKNGRNRMKVYEVEPDEEDELKALQEEAVRVVDEEFDQTS